MKRLLLLPLLVVLALPNTVNANEKILSCMRSSYEEKLGYRIYYGFWLINGKLYSTNLESPEPSHEIGTKNNEFSFESYQTFGNQVIYKGHIVGLEDIEFDHWLIDFDRRQITVLTGNLFHKTGEVFKCD